MLRRFLPLALVSFLSLLVARDGRVEPNDPAARGLDMFVHMASSVASGSKVIVDLAAVGYSTTVDSRPLAGATFEIGWHAESLGEGEHAPPDLQAKADAQGHAHLEIGVPEGSEKSIELLVAVRSKGHERTRTFTVNRTARASVRLAVSEAKVVAGSSVSAWVTARSVTTDMPLPKQKISLTLEEGAYRHASAIVETDDAGVGSARIPIPFVDNPRIGFRLVARLMPTADVVDSLALQLRDETPATPRLFASWQESSLRPGEVGHYTLALRDASGRPVERLPVRVWVGKKGERVPEGIAWTQRSQAMTTNSIGEIRGEARAPTLLKGAASVLTLVAETNLEGDAVKAKVALDVRAPVASAELFPEAKALVPGLEQRIFLRLNGDDGNGVAGHFTVKGDGLGTAVDTNANGEAEFTWRTPESIGASRDQGPCSGGVAATVNIESTSRPAIQTCIEVNRDAEAIVRGDVPVLRVGERVHLSVDARAGHEPAAGYSVVLQSGNSEGVQSAWVDARTGADFVVGRGAAGIWSATAAGPRGAKKALLASRALLVAPSVLPRVTARIVGGRAVPGGTVEVEAALDDGAGHPLRGSISAVRVDARGGSDLTPLLNFDTRRSMCRQVGVDARCDELLGGSKDKDATAFRRAMVSNSVQTLEPAVDPASHAKEDLQKAFEDVLHSLEGAVLEATANPAKLTDVRRKIGGGWQFNPELFTLVTAAMDPPPVTPGGEPIVLGDLLAVDKQVTFDAVARRVTRLKLFRILSAVRTFKHEHANDRGEPVWREPNAVLRRLVREETLTEDGLLDPWGGTIAFSRATTRPPPFLDILPGYSLRAPGPDGALGTGDDVKDPFERVLRSKSPYAEAVQEDRLVDAQFDIEVGDSTVSAWETLFTELTGTTLGDTGEGGGGTGSGFGRLGGSHVSRSVSMRGNGAALSLPRGADFWLAPQRTGSDGKLRFKVPLGAIPTTWRIGVVADSDAGAVATSSLDVQASMPLSVRVDTGAQWIAGDEVEARLDVRNDTASARVVRLSVTAGGVAALAGPLPKPVTVPARGTASAFVRVRAARAGIGQLDVRAGAAGIPGDQARIDVIVRPAGEGITKARAVWVSKDQELTLPIDSGELPDGKARLVLERGLHRTLSDALHSLGPAQIATAHGALSAAEVAHRVERWATVLGASDLVEQAKALRDIAGARFSSLAVASDPSLAFLSARARAFYPATEDPKAAKASKGATKAGKDGKETPCPTAIPSLYGALLALESSPPRATPSWAACWDQAVADAISTVQNSSDAVAVARAILALADDAQRSAATGALADKLRALVSLSPNGDVVLPATARSRESRIVVRAALLRAAALGRAAEKPGAVSAATLAPWVEVERDAGGGFGSPLATRAAVAALLDAGPTKNGATGRSDPIAPEASPSLSTVTVESDGRTSRVVVDATGRLSIPLDDRGREALVVRVRVTGPPVLARLERPLLRSYTHPPLEAEAPLVLDVVWPKNPSTAHTDLLTVTLRKAAPFVSSADIRIPLPAGASLARAQPGAIELGGMLYLSHDMQGEDEKVIQVPIRFGLRGRLLAAEATARVTSDDAARAIAPARPIVVQ